MLVNLGNIFTRDDTEKTLNAEYDFSSDKLSYDAVFTQPVISNLHLKKEDRDIRINLSVKAVADCTCARCLRSFKKDFEFSRDFILTPAIPTIPKHSTATLPAYLAITSLSIIILPKWVSIEDPFIITPYLSE